MTEQRETTTATTITASNNTGPMTATVTTTAGTNLFNGFVDNVTIRRDFVDATAFGDTQRTFIIGGSSFTFTPTAQRTTARPIFCSACGERMGLWVDEYDVITGRPEAGSTMRCHKARSEKHDYWVLIKGGEWVPRRQTAIDHWRETGVC